jgi:hypothetical protein
MSQVSDDARATFSEMFLDAVVSKYPELSGDERRAGLRYLATVIATSCRTTGRAQAMEDLRKKLGPALQADLDSAVANVNPETLRQFSTDPRAAFRATLIAAYVNVLNLVDEFGSQAAPGPNAPNAPELPASDESEGPVLTTTRVGKA